jgi:flagellar assembly protein FliH
MSRIREKKAPPAANIEALLALGRSATTGQFAKTVRSTSDTTFRALSWSDVAVPLADQPPVPVEDTPEGETTADAEDTSETTEIPAEDDHPSEPVEPDPEIAEDAQPSDGPPAPPAIDEAELQRIRDDAYAEGLSAGKAMTESAREHELSVQLQQLEQIIARLGADDLIETDVLSERIHASVLELASQRIGFALEDMPDVMITRIESLIADMAHLAGIRELFVAPDDLELVRRGFDSHQNPPPLQLRSDPSLHRGDARLRVGGAEISDTLDWADPEPVEEPPVKADA